MLLDLRKRNLLLMLLPKSGSLDGQLRCKELAERLRDLSDEYKEQLCFEDLGNGMFKYDIAKDVPVEFPLSESELHVLKRGIDELDKEEKITLDLVDVCKEVREMCL